ncbi:D-alanyl-D-alanine carboxypeptidase [Microbacterium sp. W1N]|uniref:D-alanyl-D-alanine carboxypeptidase family protein n=1 Tax=Microbacterium festucae TaxID=2977531 RepID=UPI0021C115F7|nr:D-alanyl-D-alanine carboxypeptidase [Microbacterium festucae]MCT9821141.1 D-alanyl-D-alanine carboxypeptidase [Microbacterium festucae]
MAAIARGAAGCRKSRSKETALDDLTELLSREQELLGDAPAPTDPAPRRGRRIGLIVAALVVVLLLVVPAGYVAWALSAALPDPVETSAVPAVATVPPAALAAPTVGAFAISVAGADDYLGPDAAGIWAAGGGDQPLPMASISKLVTALVVLDRHPLTHPTDAGPAITFDKAAHALYDEYYVRGATIAPMPTGTTMSLREALAAMLLPSASNYAEAVAGWAYGSQGAFLSATRRWLAANGLTQTTIVEPTGIDARNTSTTADMIALGRLAAANPVVASLARTPSLDIPGAGVVRNTNPMLGELGITGLKTGTLEESGSNLLYTASLDVGLEAPLSIVGVQLGAEGRASLEQSVRGLLQSIAGGFDVVPLAEEGRLVGTYETPWGSEARMVLSADASLFTWRGRPVTATMETQTPTTWLDGEQVGTVSWTDGLRTTSVPVRIEGDITEPDAWWRLTHPGELR